MLAVATRDVCPYIASKVRGKDVLDVLHDLVIQAGTQILVGFVLT